MDFFIFWERDRFYNTVEFTILCIIQHCKAIIFQQKYLEKINKRYNMLQISR